MTNLPLSLALFSLVSTTVAAQNTQDGNNTIETLVITATGTLRNKDDLAESVTLFDEKAIQTLAPSHPSELLNRSAGVYINNLGGEGHMTAIRQPLSTRGVYLFLEDGIPSRPTGFFNHNGLYEINIPQSGCLEVIKGPGTALYGSEAIGGIINSITQPPSDTLDTRINLEGGSHGYKRALLSNSATYGDHGYRINVNATDSDGYRDDSAFSRQSYTGRWDVDASETLNIKTFLSYTHVDQAGVSSLNKNDYENHPRKNFFKDDVGGRRIDALRLSTKIDMQISPAGQLTLTPFIRVNESQMMPSWMVTYDANARDTQFKTYGLLSKYRLYFDDIDGELVLGADIDYTPSHYKEMKVTMVTKDIADQTYYLSYTETGGLNYNFDATQQSASPFVHFDMLLTEDLRFSTGLRYDYFTVYYQDNMPSTVSADPKHIRPNSQTVNYDSWSPKLGLVYAFNESHNTYFNYRHAFRAPTVGELFRSGSNVNTDQLKPVKADSVEVGFRGSLNDALMYEAAAYYMVKKDDIVSIINEDTRETVNAGETEHTGLELTLFGDLSDEFSYTIAGSYSEQTYKTFEYIFQCFSPACGRIMPGPIIKETRDFNGNDIAQAPKTIANATLAYTPFWLSGLRLETEWTHIGKYYVDDDNTETYAGHDLLNVRANYQIIEDLELYARVQNIANDRYSTQTAKQPGASDTAYRPGLPRSYYAGIRYSF